VCVCVCVCVSVCVCVCVSLVYASSAVTFVRRFVDATVSLHAMLTPVTLTLTCKRIEHS
jgi:7,8-dihydro-6-hydroxymethylpterin-pyrophosphokinase